MVRDLQIYDLRYCTAAMKIFLDYFLLKLSIMVVINIAINENEFEDEASARLKATYCKALILLTVIIIF